MYRKVTTTFKDMSEADRKLYIAEVFHHMFYDDNFFKQISILKNIHEERTDNEPVFFPPVQDEQLEQLKNKGNA